jgi:putative oxidoreductase
MTSNETATGTVTQSRSGLKVGAPLIAMWVTQVALAAMFLMAGGSKLAGVPARVSMFDAIGVGQWFRYVTGLIEAASGIALLVPTAVIRGALLIIPTMVGPIVTNAFILHTSPVMLLLLLLGAAVVAWVRRGELAGAVARLRD